MQPTKKKVVFGFLGTKLDAGLSEKRHEKWRPSVALFGHPKFEVDQLEMFRSSAQHTELGALVIQDIRALAPTATVVSHQLSIEDPWNFQEAYTALHAFAKSYAFRDDCEYYVHLTTGTHVAQICLFILLESKYFPAKIIESFSHAPRNGEAWRGSQQVIDLNLSAYDVLAKRFDRERVDSQGFEPVP